MTTDVRALILSGLVIAALPTASAADDRLPTYTGSAGFTFLKGGPHQSIARTMTGLGFGNPYDDSKSPELLKPFDLIAQLHRRVHGRMAVGTLASRVRGYTYGLQRYTDISGQPKGLYASVSYHVDTNAVLASWWLTEYLHAGIGPALHTTYMTLDVTSGSNLDDRYQDLGSRRTLGLVSDVTLMATRPQSPWTMELSLQHRTVQRRQLGPAPASPTLTWPRSQVAFSHYMIAASVGFRSR